MGRERIQILDGGMGTTLESLGHSVSSDLWGSELLYSNPGVIQSIHRGYVEAGADLVETSTYQLTTMNLSTYLSSTNPIESLEECEKDSKSILRSSVDLVYNSFPISSNPSTSSSSSKTKGKGVVFSCGPYGSTLKPGAEYSGYYPLPFGPNSSISSSSTPTTTSTSSSLTQINYFGNTEEGKLEEEIAIQHLTKFHLDKLLTIATDEETWKKIKWIGFETIPVLFEIKAIRKAMEGLNNILKDRYSSSTSNSSGDVKEEEGEGEKWYIKKFWIASPFPNGQFPQLNPDGVTHMTISDLVDTLLDGDAPKPNGIGINCTNPKYLSTLIREFTQTMKNRMSKDTKSLDVSTLKPTFVLYPDGGQIYDVITRSWSTTNGNDPKEWASGILDIVIRLEKSTYDEEEEGEYIWDGVIVGGCCKTSFEEIRALKDGLDGGI